MGRKKNEIKYDKSHFIQFYSSEGNGRKYRLYIMDAGKYVIGNLQAPCQVI